MGLKLTKKFSEIIQNFFHKQLFEKDKTEAIDYLYGRGLKKNIIEEFEIGYVPWQNTFYDFLKNKYSDEDISLTGLYYKNDKTGKYIDRFNSRIIFPVNNLTVEILSHLKDNTREQIS